MEQSATATIERRETQERASEAVTAARPRGTWAVAALMVGPVVAVVSAAVLASGTDTARGPALIAFLIGLGAAVTGERTLDARSKR